MKLSESTVATYRRNLEVVEARRAGGLTGPMDLQLAKSQLNNAQASLTDDRGALGNAQRSLELLLGRYPKAELAVAIDLPALPKVPPTGLPSELLERRPDIVAADRRVAAAFQRLESARAARLPRIAITGNTGTAGPDLASILDPAHIVWNIGGTPSPSSMVVVAKPKRRCPPRVLGRLCLSGPGSLQRSGGCLAAETVVRERISFVQASVAELENAATIARKQYETASSMY